MADVRSMATSDLIRAFVECAQVDGFIGVEGGHAREMFDLTFSRTDPATPSTTSYELALAAEIDRRIPIPSETP